MIKRIVFYVTPHGYGHATRQGAVMAALRRLGGQDFDIVARTTAPRWIFDAECEGVRYEPEVVDIGLIQPTGLEIDMEASLKGHLDFIHDWPIKVRREVEFLSAVKADMVISDVSALAFDSASQAGIPSMAIANFGWDWILDYYARQDERWRPIVNQYRQAYGKCSILMRLPFHEPCEAFPRAKDMGLLVRRRLVSRDEVRQKLGWGKNQRVVLVSFGGFGGGNLPFVDCDAAEDFLIVSFEPKPSGYRGHWRQLNRDLGFRSLDLVTSCDAVISKPGYGIISECLTYDMKLLLLPRRNYPESAVLLEGIERQGCVAEMPEQDFFSGRWRKHLEQLWLKNCHLGVEQKNSDDAIAQEVLSLIS